MIEILSTLGIINANLGSNIVQSDVTGLLYIINRASVVERGVILYLRRASTAYLEAFRLLSSIHRMTDTQDLDF